MTGNNGQAGPLAGTLAGQIIALTGGTRGLGLARRLMEATEAAARDLGIKVLRLDTNKALPEALQLYRGSGWTEIDRFNDDPYPDFFFEKTL